MRRSHIGRAAVAAAGLLVGLAALLPSAQADEAHGGQPAAATDPTATATATATTTATGNWQEVNVGTTPAKMHAFHDVVSTVSGDVLATDPGQDIRCWNGTGWEVVPKPGIPQMHNSDYIASLGGISCSDFYIYDQESLSADTAPGRWHWDGTTWQHTLTGDTYPSMRFQAFAANDMWDFSYHYAHHFDGTSWNTVALPDTVSSPDIVTGTSGKDLWLMGSSNTSPFGPLAYHWNGTKWVQSTLPSTWTSKNSEQSAVTVSSNEVYVFDFTTANGYLRWDGTTWHKENTGVSLPAVSDYTSGAAYSGGTVWLSVAETVLRLDNGVWTKSPLPAVSDPSPIDVRAIAADPRTDTVIAGGGAGGEQAPRPVLLQYQN
ncbi:hypothetical protein [Streptomyces sp. NPDC087270]|uniref:hypothetical protein n=1 Tax=Streptomyces sp. NPDC087270 TaxID=3365774 RepID=UPI00382C02C4